MYNERHQNDNIQYFMAIGEVRTRGVRRNKANAVPAIPEAWVHFIAKLVTVLSGLEQDALLTLQPQVGGEWIQFARQEGNVRLECKSDYFRMADQLLTAEQLAKLAVVGWNRPTGSADQSCPESDHFGSPNYFLDMPMPLDQKVLDRIVAGTFQGAFGVPEPSHLRYEAFTAEGDSLLLPSLELKPLTSSEENMPLTKLQAQLKDAMAELSGVRDLEYDADGDLGPINYKGVTAYLRVVEGSEFARIYVPLISDIESSPELLEKLNEFNSTCGYMHTCHLNQAAMAVTDIAVAPFVKGHFARGMGNFLQITNEIAEELRQQFPEVETSGPTASPRNIH